MANAIIQAGRPGTVEVVAYTGTHGVMATAIEAQTYAVRVVCTTASHIKFGAAPTATTSDIYMPAGVPEYFVVTPGQKISAVQVSAGGNMHVLQYA